MSNPLPPPVAIRLTTLPPQPCNYIPGRVATTRAFLIDELPGDLYHKFMDAGFRRSGRTVYQQACADCQQCVPIRVDVSRFTPSKSQLRSIRKNSDLSITVSEPQLTDEKFDLYRRYLIGWHGRDPTKADDRDSLEQFLYRSPVQTIEFCYRDKSNNLLGVGIGDVCSSSFSSVYFYFDPVQSRRGLGTFSAMHEISWCRRMTIPFYYLGFWIQGCPTMAYKSHFRPAEVLGVDGIWRDLMIEDR